MKTLLVLEDEFSVMKLLRHWLKDYSLIEATTAEEALQVFIASHFAIQLLLADVTLPTSSGIHVALLLRSKTPGLPVILTCGYPLSGWSKRDSADLKRLGSGSVTILQKPFQLQGLRDAVSELIGAPQHEEARTA